MTNTEVILQNLSIGQLQGKIKRYEMIELGGPGGIAAGTTNRVNFEDQPQLRTQPNQIIIIRNIEIFLVTTYSNSQFTPALVGIPAAEIPKLVLVLSTNGEEAIHYLPLAKLHHIDDGVVNPFQWDLQGVDNLYGVEWNKSYVQYSVASAGGPYIIPFGISYYRFQKDPTMPDKWIEK